MSASKSPEFPESPAKAVLVTGAGSGIGRAVAMAFGRGGANVAIADVDRSAADDVATELAAIGCQAVASTCDVARPSDIETTVELCVSEFGRLDVVVANAGIGMLGTVEQLDVDAWDRLFAINVRSLFVFAKHAVPHLRVAGGGSILATASLGGLLPGNGTLAYSASKAAVINMCRTLALDLGPQHIRVNCVCPGATRTPSLQAQFEQAGIDEAMYAAMVPLGAIGTPDDIADAFVFLASDAAKHITGQAIVVDGGQQAGMFMPPADVAPT
jgi:NAD(P)-dependent dehydrogenase (short-subunit alcohol dehydrogenase family)